MDGATVESVNRTDLKLIRCLQENPRASYATMARATELSETTIRRRVEALINDGVITPAMMPDTLRLGYPVTAFVALKIDVTHRRAVASAIANLPSVTYVAETLGRYDVLLLVAEREVVGLTTFLEEQIAILPGVRDTEVMVIPRTHKSMRAWRVPLDDNGDVAQRILAPK
ncbi:hypothetical protein BH24CHL1_BH24CHL1_15450 [soil metagenome]